MSSLYKHFAVGLLGTFLLVSCGAKQSTTENADFTLHYLDEYIIPGDLKVDQLLIGGLSDLDYDGQHYYSVRDSRSAPSIHQFDIVIKNTKIDTVRFLKTITIKHDSGAAKGLKFDSEGLIYNPKTKLFTLSSEGSIANQDNPFIATIDANGELQDRYAIPDYFKATTQNGPRNNGVFEGLTESYNGKGIWVAMELPLKADGPAPKLYRTKSPVRITYYNRESKRPVHQFAYRLDRLRKVPFLPFAINGISAILEYKPQQFLVLERGFGAGNGRHGIRARLFLVDARKATNTLALKSLKGKLGQDVILAQKTLIFDFNWIQNQLPDRIIDNLEGIAFGPKLANGHQSLLIIADNNFRSPKEINQLILMELIPQ